MSDLIYSPLFRNWAPLVALAESPEPPKLWIHAPLAATKEHIKEAWRSVREFVRDLLTSEPYIAPSSGIIDFSPTFDNEERLILILRLLIPVFSLAGSLGLIYYLIEQLNPTAKEKRAARKKANELLSYLHVNPIPKLTDYEVCIAVSLVDTTTLETGWANIGGLDDLITDLRESVILPFRSAYFLPQSKLFRAPKGVLLYGPPGCGKTLLARATARAANARFFNLQISNLVNMWYGESQKLAEAVFSLAHKLQPSIIFLDEIDSFLTTRSVHDNESTRMMKTQFMALWDGLLSEPDSRIIVIGATNRPSDLDSAILRRLPYKVYVPLPNAQQRLEILKVHLHNEPLDALVTPEFLKSFAEQTEGLSGSDLFEICREAALRGFRAWLHASPSSPQSVESSSTSPAFVNPSISVGDFEYAFRKFKNNQLVETMAVTLPKLHEDDPD